MSSGSAPNSSGSAKCLILAGAIIVQLILGTIYGYSIFWEPLTARVFPTVITEAHRMELLAQGADLTDFKIVADASAVQRERAMQQGYLKYAFSICVLTFAAVMVFAGRVQDLKGPRYTATIGAVLMGGGFIVAGMMNSPMVFFLAHSLFAGLIALLALMLFHAWFGHLDPNTHVMARYTPLVIIAVVIVAGVSLANQYVGKLQELDRLFLLWGTVGFLAGAGVGFAYVCPIAALVKWFPNHKGLVSGVAVAGFGFGAYLFSRKWGALGFIDEFGITRFFIVHGIVCLVGISLGALLLRNPPGFEAKPAAPSESRWQETLRQPSFYVLWAMFFSASVAGLGVIGIIKVFAGEQLVLAAKEAGQTLVATDMSGLMAKGAQAVGVLAVFNALGRVIWGFVSDRVGRTPTFVVMFMLQAITMFSLGAMKSELALVVAASLVGFNYGGAFALFPSATADLFGAKNLGANYGWVFTSYGIAGVVGIAAGNAAKVLTGSYVAAFSLAGTLCVCAAILALLLRRMHKAVQS